MTTILLHGFWSQPADWAPVIRLLPLHAEVVCPDLYEPGPLAPHHSLEEWVGHFYEWISENGWKQPQLVGYSMGARLGLNALVRSPEKFSRVLLCSGQPVLAPSEWPAREAWEMNWRERFLSQPWLELERAWQDQAVFRHDESQPRRHSVQLREMLGQSLVHWSPRHHAFTWDDLKALPSSVDWAYGALDQNYLNAAKSLQDLPVQGQISRIENAGHRIPAERADFVASWIARGV